ncbi:hypothetical protein BG015_005481 [Linnemannia schmuckeri]|uniref:Glutathione S-transferase n=1 Tax=Linnemannia schmuckeri TaxID=64567 RepID=A0A9P5S3G6_9FUNG|nr:hypothetical protein BG015_005481 [Linnemannia schmuckeri]
MVATFPKSTTATQVLDSPTSTFSLLYFDTQGICSPMRNLLVLGDAQWTQLYPQEWENEDLADKQSTPFEVLPVLYVHSQDGSQTVPIAESKAIEDYLAARFGRLGRDTYERAQIQAFNSSTTALIDNFLGTVINLQASPEVKHEQMVTYLAKKVPNWIRIHEEHLRANGSNGHYVGDSITLADLKSAMLVDMILRFPPGATLINPESAPALLKVKAAIDEDPKIKAWRETELYKSLRSSRAAPVQPRAASVKLNDRKGNLTGGIVPPPLTKEK